MIDEKTKDIMDLYDIKQDMIKIMLNKYTSKNISKEDFTKFFKYLNLQLKDNNSKNNLDSRINSIYKVIQKQYDNYIKLNEIITQLD